MIMYRYTKVAREYQNVRGDKGWHLIGKVGLTELEEQVVLGAYHIGDGYVKMKSEIMRIFRENKKREKEKLG